MLDMLVHALILIYYFWLRLNTASSVVIIELLSLGFDDVEIWEYGEMISVWLIVHTFLLTCIREAEILTVVR